MTGSTTDPALPNTPWPNYGVLAQAYTSIVVRTVTQSAQVLADAVDEYSAGKLTGDEIISTTGKLTTITLLGSLEAATTLLGGPQFNVLSNAAHTAWFDIPDQTTSHQVNLPGPFTRAVSDDIIAKGRFGFEARKSDGSSVQCPGGVLPAGTKEFRLLLNRFGIHSGCYTGKLTVTKLPVDTTAPPPTPVDVEIEL